MHSEGGYGWGGGAEVYGKSLYFLLNFAVNLKLLEKIVYQKKKKKRGMRCGSVWSCFYPCPSSFFTQTPPLNAKLTILPFSTSLHYGFCTSNF